MKNEAVNTHFVYKNCITVLV